MAVSEKQEVAGLPSAGKTDSSSERGQFPGEMVELTILFQILRQQELNLNFKRKDLVYLLVKVAVELS